MHSKSPKIFFENEKKLKEYLASETREREINKVGILAGHFMLGYEREKDSLLPLIQEENNSLKNIAELLSGIFPLRSFILGIDCLQAFKEKNIESKIILVVNDHQFDVNTNYKDSRDSLKNRGGELRRTFYAETKLIPDTFVSVLSERGLQINACILNNNSVSREEQDILPKETYYFSEQILNRRFRRNTADEYIEKAKFYVTEGTNGKEVRFRSGRPKGDYCVVGSGQSGCTGIAIEIILEMVSRGLDEIILILPNDCAESVNYAAEIALNLLEKKVKIILVYNLHDPEDHIIVEEHQLIT